MPGFLAVLIVKLAGLGAVTKVAAATTTAALTMALVGAGTGVLPVPSGAADTALVARGGIDHATAAEVSSAFSLPVGTSGGTAAPAAAVVLSPTDSTSAKASTVVPTPAAAPAKLPSLSNVGAVSNVATPTIPTLPAIPRCVANLLPTGGTPPDPTMLVAQLPACIQSVVAAHLPLDTVQRAIGSANLPVALSKCLSAVLGSVPGFVGSDLSDVPRLLAACLPTGPVSGTGSIPGTGSLPGAGSIPGIGSLPGISSGR